MCGIAGIYNFKTLDPVTQSLLKAMTDTLVHRGPDDEGFYVSGPLGLGHRRLSIIDLEGGHQPIANEGQHQYTQRKSSVDALNHANMGDKDIRV